MNSPHYNTPVHMGAVSTGQVGYSGSSGSFGSYTPAMDGSPYSGRLGDWWKSRFERRAGRQQKRSETLASRAQKNLEKIGAALLPEPSPMAPPGPNPLAIGLGILTVGAAGYAVWHFTK